MEIGSDLLAKREIAIDVVGEGESELDYSRNMVEGRAVETADDPY